MYLDRFFELVGMFTRGWGRAISQTFNRTLAIGVFSMGLAISAWAVPEGQVDINTASAEELAEVLVGVGEARASAIVEYRKQHGHFTDLADLLAVRGIGAKVLEDNAQRIVVDD